MLFQISHSFIKLYNPVNLSAIFLFKTVRTQHTTSESCDVFWSSISGGVPPWQDPTPQPVSLLPQEVVNPLSTDLPMQNEVRIMLNPYDNDSRCIPPSFITTLSLTPRHLMFCNESDVDGMAM